MTNTIAFGKKQVVGGRLRVYYYGYWIKAYEVPADTLLAKKRLIEALTRRLFNHVEHGINVPGSRLEEARAALAAESNAKRQRVKSSMLAGCLFNRAADIFTKLVEIQAIGVTITADNALMRECGDYLQEALELGKQVLHRSGEEGLDELWGEPFKAFAFSIEEFYNSRYIKIAQSMQAIDRLREEVSLSLSSLPAFEGASVLVNELATAAKVKCETLRTDDEIFDVWTSFAVARERVTEFEPAVPSDASGIETRHVAAGKRLLIEMRDLVTHITRARVPMPKTTGEFVERCARFRELLRERSSASASASAGASERGAA
jgi:hypothetical protein